MRCLSRPSLPTVCAQPRRSRARCAPSCADRLVERLGDARRRCRPSRPAAAPRNRRRGTRTIAGSIWRKRASAAARKALSSRISSFSANRRRPRRNGFELASALHGMSLAVAASGWRASGVKSAKVSGAGNCVPAQARNMKRTLSCTTSRNMGLRRSSLTPSRDTGVRLHHLALAPGRRACCRVRYASGPKIWLGDVPT